MLLPYCKIKPQNVLQCYIPTSFFNHSLLWEDETPWERGCSLGLDVTNASGDNFPQNWNPSHEDNFVSKTRDQPKPGSFFDHSLLWEDERPWERGCVIFLSLGQIMLIYVETGRAHYKICLFTILQQ